MKSMSSVFKHFDVHLIGVLVLLFLAVLFSYDITTVYAQSGYLGSGHFGTGSLRWVHEGVYYNPNYWALSNWNASTNLNVTYGSSPHIKTRAYNMGDPNLAGYAYICSWIGGLGTVCNSSQALSYQYVYCEAQSNTAALDSWSYNERTFNALHELGHCWSLAHSWEANSAMIRGKHSHTWPNGTDISLVNNRH